MSAQSAHDTQGLESSLGHWAQSVYQFLSICISTCAAYYEAAAVYEDLSRLSDVELLRRGLSRGTLARDVCNGVGS
jgi:hypothetical protein